MSSVITPENSSSLFDRRDFLRLMASSIALLPLEACRDKMAPESLVPYVQAPSERLLGQAQSFATAFPVYGLTQGLLVTSHEGRPTKIEGQNRHAMSQGATSIFAQASILDLYDPSRTRVSRMGQAEKTAGDIKSWLVQMSAEQKKKRGAGFCLITEPVTSPSLWQAIENLKREWPEMLWVTWSPLHHDEIYAGTEIAFGQTLSPFYDFSKAGHIVSLDHDFLGSEHDAVARTRAWADRRRSGLKQELHMFETTLSITGAKSDQRTAVTQNDLLRLLGELEKRQGAEADFIFKGVDPLLLAGSHLSGDWQSRVHRLNRLLKSTAVRYRNPVHPSHAGQMEQLREFFDRAKAGHISTCVIIGGNPAYNAPADFDFAAALRKIPKTLHLTDFENETSRLCANVAARSHYLETWGDVETTDGTQSLMQPLILPLYDTLDDHQIFEALTLGSQARSTQAVVSQYWHSHGVNEANFKEALASGVVGHTNLFVTPSLRESPLAPAALGLNEPKLSLRFAPDPTLLDGRYAENAWLQELPKPITSLTWDNAVLIPPALAAKLGVANEDHVELRTRVGQLTAPAFILDGLPETVITLHVGSGRKVISPVGDGSGFDAYRLRTSQNQWVIAVDGIKKVAGSTQLARPQTEMPTERNDLYTETPSVGARNDIGHGEPPPLSTALHSKEYQWAMSIDLDTCTGCMNCVIACQAENNTPVVGKKQVLNGRIMHWMRIDRYVSAGLPKPQPVTCMHCEKAPCEVVCPVQATVHSSEGLNQMVYNRCVGTRYCSNNCPYKVRRFNFYKYTDDSETLKMQRNPDVTVRSRGVMEKCSYCVHRISRARIDAEKENRLIKDGEVVTACQAACPPKAIVFGNLLDEKSEVSRLRKSPRTYGLLTELGTRPRTTYMAAVHRTQKPAPKSDPKADPEATS